MAWYYDTDNNGLYEVYVGSEGKVHAPEYSSYLFSRFTKVNDLDLDNLNTTNVISMSNMFRSMTSLKCLDLSNFDTSNVTDMSSMFSGMSSLTNLDISNFDTSKVTDMNGMFTLISVTDQEYVSNWIDENFSEEYANELKKENNLETIKENKFNKLIVNNSNILNNTLNTQIYGPSVITGEFDKEDGSGTITLTLNRTFSPFYLIVNYGIDSSNVKNILDKDKKAKTGLVATGDYIGTNKVIIIGDVSGDGKINSSDLLRIRQHLLNLKLID